MKPAHAVLNYAANSCANDNAPVTKLTHLSRNAAQPSGHSVRLSNPSEPPTWGDKREDALKNISEVLHMIVDEQSR